MNRQDRRDVKVLMVGGPANGLVYFVPANRVSVDVPILPRDAHLWGPNATTDAAEVYTYVRYVIGTLRGRLGTWKVAWPAGDGECGYDVAICKILNHYNEAHSPSPEDFCTQSDIAEGEEPEIDR